MQCKLMSEGGQRSFAVVLDAGDEVTESLQRVADEESLHASRFTAIGGLSDVVLGFFQVEEQTYKRIPLREQVEVLSLVGDVTHEQGRPKVHAHVVVGLSDGTTRGGHLLEGHVRPTLEIMLIESPSMLERRHDPRFGIPLITIPPGADADRDPT